MYCKSYKNTNNFTLNVVRKPVSTNARRVKISDVHYNNFNVRQRDDSCKIRSVDKPNRRLGLHFVYLKLPT
jgi:hypothetical protein